jgi:hypothetical protein
MRATRTIFAIAILVFTAAQVVGQDIIHTNRNGRIAAKVLEVNQSDIKYKKYDNLEGPTYTMGKYEIVKIVYANSTEDVFSTSTVLQDSSLMHSRSIVKVQPFSPYFNYIAVGFEQRINSIMSLEASVGYAGLGDHERMRNIRGGFIKGGIKFFPRQSLLSSSPTSNPLIAEYIRLDVAYSAFSTQFGEYMYGIGVQPVVGQRQSVAGMVTCGLQFIFVGRLLCDMHAGLGFSSSEVRYDVTNTSDLPHAEGQYFSHFAGYGDLPYAINVGVTFGYLLK